MGLFGGGKTSDNHHGSNNSDDCKHPRQDAHIRTDESNNSKKLVADCRDCGSEWTS